MTAYLDGRHLGRTHVFGAAVVGNGPLGLIDCGPDTCFAGLVAGLRELGRRPEDVSHILVTHIHLDHSGGAWRWAREFGTTICVHPRGAAHLLAPEKLVASASRIFGADMERLWGDIQPVPPERLRVLQDNETIEIGGALLQALDTPGHAHHHHAHPNRDANSDSHAIAYPDSNSNAAATAFSGHTTTSPHSTATSRFPFPS